MFFKFISICLLFIIVHSTAKAQVGKYVLNTKEDTKELTIKEDGTFNYNYRTAWTRGVVIGSWKLTDGFLVLESEYRIDNYNVDEKNSRAEIPGVKVLLKSASKGQGPKDLDKIMIIHRNDSMVCKTSNYDVLEELENRHKTYQTGTPEQVDSLNKTDPIRYYVCPLPESVNQVLITFDQQEILYQPTNETANVFTFTTFLSKDPSYRYFDGESFFVHKKYIQSLESKEKFKKVKK